MGIADDGKMEEYAAERHRLIEIQVSHVPFPRRDGEPFIKATSAEDLKAGRYWHFWLDGKWVVLPSWFVQIVSERVNLMELPGGVTVHGLNTEQEQFLAARGRFIMRYCLDKGWDHNNLTIQQVLEIRSQEGWKTPDLMS
jgi:hypothetical protein